MPSTVVALGHLRHARLRVALRQRTATHQAGCGPGRQGVLLPRDPRAPAQARNPGSDPHPGRPAEPRLRRGSQGGRPPAFDRDAYTQRNTAERCINRLKQWRGIATRCEKSATIYLAALHIAGIFLWSARCPNETALRDRCRDRRRLLAGARARRRPAVRGARPTGLASALGADRRLDVHHPRGWGGGHRVTPARTASPSRTRPQRTRRARPARCGHTGRPPCRPRPPGGPCRKAV